MKKAISIVLISFLAVVLHGCTERNGASAGEPSFVERVGNKVYIVDQLGERWDVTQAESVGFEPGKFQYGIGRDTFVTLDDSLLTKDTSDMNETARVIGIAAGGDVKAYSVGKLARHEISNSELDGKPLAVAY